MADRVYPTTEDSPSAPPYRESVSIQMVPDKAIHKEQEQALISSPHEPSIAKGNYNQKDVIYRTPQPLPPDHPSRRGNGGGGRRRRSPCCCCLISLMVTLLIIVVIVGAAAGVLWLVLKPKAPEFNVAGADVSKLDVVPTASSSSSSSSGTLTVTGARVDAAVGLTVEVRNPNKRIGIYYDAVEVGLLYEGQGIGNGSIPAFYQGHGSVTSLGLDLEGAGVVLTAQAAAALNATLSDASQNVSLEARSRARVRVKVGAWTSGTCRIDVDCNFAVTNPRSSSSASLVSKSCSFKLRSVKLF